MKDWYERAKRKAEIVKSRVDKLFSDCCWAEDTWLSGTTPFKGLYSDINICPACKQTCNFIPKATEEDLGRDIGI